MTAEPPLLLDLEELALLLGLSAQDARRLNDGGIFTGPSGLECQLVVERPDSGSTACGRPLVKLGLKAYDLAGDEVHLFLTLQARLLANGQWYLGASVKGDLQITSLQPFHNAHELAAAFDVANFTAWSTLQLMLEAMPLAEAGYPPEQMQ